MEKVIFCSGCKKYLGKIRNAKLRKGIKFLCAECETKPITRDEAVGVIKEWGVDCDNFVAKNYHQFLASGEPTDNSDELSEYFLNYLKIVCGLGISYAKIIKIAEIETVFVDKIKLVF